MSNHEKIAFGTLVLVGTLVALSIGETAGADSEPTTGTRERPGTQTTPITETPAETAAGAAVETSTVDRFERCDRADDDRASVELLLHGEAPASMRTSALGAEASDVARDQVARLLGAVDASGLACREIEAPQGDVEYEIDVTFDGSGKEPRVAVVDVAKRNLTARVAAESGNRCLTNVMGQTSCASAPNGVAVQTTLGKIVCARGQCVQSRGGVWRCSRAAGGWAELAPDGFRCQQGCYSPTAGQCRKF